VIETYLTHYFEMFCGYFKGLIIKVNNPKRYSYLKEIRGNYRLLLNNKKKLLNEVKYLLKDNNINCHLLISRIKTIGSIDRKERYNKIRNSINNHHDSIGIKIVPKNKKDCYKIMDLLINNFKLEHGKDIINPEDFFENKKLMRNTNSICKDQIFVKINYNNSFVHFILCPKYNHKFIMKERRKYISHINQKINSKR
jgi:hypothetical protein